MNKDKIWMVMSGVIIGIATTAFGAVCYYTGESEMLKKCTKYIQDAAESIRENVPSDK